jgi:hypothetical protein
MEKRKTGLYLIIGSIGLAVMLIILLLVRISINPFGPIFFFGILGSICAGLYLWSSQPTPDVKLKQELEQPPPQLHTTQQQSTITTTTTNNNNYQQQSEPLQQSQPPPPQPITTSTTHDINKRRKTIGFVLVIVGIALLYFIIGILFICIGIFFIKPPKEPGWKNDREQVQKSSIRVFIIGTIMVLISCPVFLGDSVFMLSGSGWSGLISLVMTPVYFFGILLISYSIYINGNKWVWLYFLLLLVICIIALIQMVYSRDPNEIGYRLGWFFVFPLSYLPLLILFILSRRVKTDQEI